MLYTMLGVVVVVQLVLVYYQRRICMSTPPGLTALNKAIQDLITATNANTATINAVLPTLQASEDPAVQQAANTIESSVNALNQATQILATATAPPATPAPSAKTAS